MGFSRVERKVGYGCLLGAGACLGAWLGGGPTSFAVTGLILAALAGTWWIAAFVWDNTRGR